MYYSNNFFQLFSSFMKLCVFFVMIIVSGVSYSMSPRLVNFDNAKNALRTALNLDPTAGPLSIITVTRTPINPGPTELISHDEFRELLRILYPLCSGSDAPMYSKFADFGRCCFLSAIPGVDHIRDFWWRVTEHQEVNLNDIAVSTQEICDVSDMCQNLKRFHNRYLRNSCNVLVFNEMFFSQVEPLTVTQKDFINFKFFEMSRVSPYTFFYPNYLYTETRRTSGHAIYNIYRHMKRASRLHNDFMDIGGDRTIITDCADILRANVQDDNNFYNQLFLINETYCICNGRVATKYKKKSYFNESNDTIRGGAVYDHGEGRDIGLRGSPLTIRTALLANISSEICFDLAHGVRAHNHWNNGLGQSALHILQSNCIDPFDDNIARLPLDVPIIYADSYLNYQKCGVPFCHDYGLGRRQGGEPPL